MIFTCMQAAPGRRPSTAESPGRLGLSRATSDMAPCIKRPASAASETSALSPGAAYAANHVCTPGKAL